VATRGLRNVTHAPERACFNRSKKKTYSKRLLTEVGARGGKPDRTSIFEEGHPRRNVHNIGARDIAVLRNVKERRRETGKTRGSKK